MRRLPLLRATVAAACAALLGAAACAPDHSLAPPQASGYARIPIGRGAPGGDSGTGVFSEGVARSGLAHCTRREPASGSALIGPDGGTLVVGTSQLIIPAGALAAPTLITATVPADTIASIRFEPAGLTFKKPAGLIMDTAGCDVLDSGARAPDVVYLNDEGLIVEYIQAIFSNLWHTVAAPIEHFSQYAIAV